MNSENSVRDTMDQLNAWADKYQAALDSGVFGDQSKNHVPSQMTSEPSFFGLHNTHPTDEVDSVDATYWNMVQQMSSEYSGDPMQLIQEQSKKKEIQAVAAAVAAAPHPVHRSSLGPDQDSETSMDNNWTVEDLEKLSELKIQLHELGDKIAEMTGASNDAKLKQLKKQIDELSDSLGMVQPNLVERG